VDLLGLGDGRTSFTHFILNSDITRLSYHIYIKYTFPLVLVPTIDNLVGMNIEEKSRVNRIDLPLGEQGNVHRVTDFTMYVSTDIKKGGLNVGG
jgi:hypothetical protein